MAEFDFGYLIGSLASRSINRRLASALVRLAPPDLVLREIPIGDLPLYSSTIIPTIQRWPSASRKRSSRSMPSYSSRPNTTGQFPVH